MNNIPESMRALAFPIEQLKPDPRNARSHGQRNLQAVRQSLEKFGWRNVIVAREDHTVIAGNARLEAARSLGWTHAPVLFVQEDAKTSTAFAIADNRTAELAEWNMEMLSAALSEIEAEDLPGFELAEIESILAKPLLADYQITEVEQLNQQAQEQRVKEMSTSVLRVRVPRDVLPEARAAIEACAKLYQGVVE